jgi:phenylalanyl-tRNA synthetase alpha subunit
MNESEPLSQTPVQPAIDPIYKGAIEKKSQQNRTAKDLIETEWKIIDKLQKLADDPAHKHQQAFYYQTLASHVRTLSVLLKLHGKQDDSQDLAKLLSEIDTNASKLAKRLKQRCKR